MLSPFPGMDPYLEDPAIWSDFHGTTLMGLRAELNERLPAPYLARWDRYVWVDEADVEPVRPLGKPDVFMVDQLSRSSEVEQAALGIAAPAMATVPEVEPRGKPYIKIIDRRGRRVVTVIEFLSPANKSSGKDREAYLAKRQEYFRTGTNLVEMDFLRAGLRPPVQEKLPPASYYLLVSRAVDFPRVGIWPLGIRDRLPTIPVPLNPDDPPVMLDLRPCMDRAYDEGTMWTMTILRCRHSMSRMPAGPENCWPAGPINSDIYPSNGAHS